MLQDQQLLDHACGLYGIALAYTDIDGNRHEVPSESKMALLAAMAVPTTSDQTLRDHLARVRDERCKRMLSPVQVERHSAGRIRIAVTLLESMAGAVLRWTLVLESGERHQGQLEPGDLEPLQPQELQPQELQPQEECGGGFRRYALVLPLMPPVGYHDFMLSALGPAQANEARTVLIITPERCYRPPAVTGEGRLWGLATQLYAVRSRRNWGIGDFTDLKVLLAHAAALGAGLIGINPLHALFSHNPEHASPYSPSSRLFLNMLYLDVEAMADFAECESVRSTVQAPQFQARLRAIRAEELVDYREVMSLKQGVLERLFEHFRAHHLAVNTCRSQQFVDFKTRAGASLYRFALFETLQAHLSAQDKELWGWPVWPEPYRDPDSEEVADFARRHATRVELFMYLQWQADLQLEEAAARARELDLAIGIYRDLAVGVDPGGAEAWTSQEVYGLAAHIGAPGDAFNLEGQDWGAPPFIPDRLREVAYRPFIELLRRNMHSGGALRIDHVMGLMRLFWVPAGAEARCGSYVSYPAADLLAILALESQRNRCLVVGEDLGTVPEGVRETLMAAGILSYRLLYFEKDPDGGFRAPADYPEQALTAIGTHDLSTLQGYWRGADLALREALGQFPSRDIRDDQIVGRAQDRARLLVALDREGLLPPGITVDPASAPAMSVELIRAIHGYLCRTPCKLMTVQLEDVFEQLEQVNLPGTTGEYPNWRRKLPLNLEDWLDDQRLRSLVEGLSEERGSRALTQSGTDTVTGGAQRVATMPVPGATYRLRLNRGFTFAKAAQIVPYLAELGITHCYVSPYLKARPGSTHGYDIIDHNAINPELGSWDDFEGFVEVLRAHGMGHILDMVPNHMGVMGSDNAWWLDVLENGPAAVHAPYFDIDWQPSREDLRGKLVVPVLGDRYGKVLEQGDLKLTFDRDAGSFDVLYFEHRFPVDPREYGRILGHRIERLQARLGDDAPQVLEYQSLITAFGNLPGRHETQPERVQARCRDKEFYKRQLAELRRQCMDVDWFLEENLEIFNGRPGEPQSFDRLHELLQHQAYRLAFWRVAADDVNYRRFFDVDALAALRMESGIVFAETHRLVLELLAAGKIDGLRIDHPDGLYDPQQYFQRLQHAFAKVTGISSPDGPAQGAEHLYVVVEKILAGHERLPKSWPVAGTTGYGFANVVNGLFVDSEAQPLLQEIYREFVGEPIEFEELVYRSKKLIIKFILAGGLNVLANRLSRIAQTDRHTRDFTRNRIRSALAEVVACFPVYRTYVTAAGASEDDRRHVGWAVAVAKKRARVADLSIFDFIHDVLLLDAAEGKPEALRREMVDFAMRFQQYTAPVMAKGVEDTSFYNYNRLVSLNEVGGEPDRFGVSVAAFHHFNREHAELWPHAMLCSSTHDSKRSEDVRARINVLSECPEEWRGHLLRWGRLNASKKREVSGQPAPSANDEYLLYQTLVGAWPLEALDEAGLQAFCQRIQSYMLKAVREAKAHTSWVSPDTEYETALEDFIEQLLVAPGENRFLAEFVPFQQRISKFGTLNSLSQCLLKLTCPGVPDIYQGTEVLDFSLVDPDNRRPVDYFDHWEKLRALRSCESANFHEMLTDGFDFFSAMDSGASKLFVISKVLEIKQKIPRLFDESQYIALSVRGKKAEHVCAFARCFKNHIFVVVVPRLMFRLFSDEASFFKPSVWGETAIDLPENFGGQYRNIFTQRRFVSIDDDKAPTIPAGILLSDFPVGALIGEI